MPSQLKKALMIVAGIVFIFAGILGAALPFAPGFVPFVIGAVLLSLASTRIRDWMEMHTRRFPRIHKFVAKTQEWVVRIIGPTH